MLTKCVTSNGVVLYLLYVLCVEKICAELVNEVVLLEMSLPLSEREPVFRSHTLPLPHQPTSIVKLLMLSALETVIQRAKGRRPKKTLHIQ